MLLNPEIRNYDVFRTKILTPDDYADICEEYDDVCSLEDWDELEYISGDHPSYTCVYKTIRRTCAEQQEIIEAGRDSTLMNLAFNLLFNLKELVLVFRDTKGHEDWERYYHEMFGMAQPRSYEHHIQLLLAALKGRKLTLKVIQLTCLKPRNDSPWQSFHWDSLTTPLTELVGYAPCLRLVESGMALTLLRRVSLNLRELSLCSMYMKLAFMESFLRFNATSLRSLSVHDAKAFDQGNAAHLTPAHVGDKTGLIIEREKKAGNLSCSCSFQEGWKLFFSAPKPGMNG
ncbi:hypothetical protein PENARI_c054G07558 [Penicillium arizonense]|uniref:Uncharacterized protein n=1 Tax=Penicillium arizonense TaxID=1835702 RepID=A0A1F5L1Z4_PENAI|nr:hypothetical protein PENARI_c054G07558 [Penicillium arizonense]OGE47225.1 hypothetical protein PENARI_c054G07558 [Penicillium arizonense]